MNDENMSGTEVQCCVGKSLVIVFLGEEGVLI